MAEPIYRDSRRNRNQRLECSIPGRSDQMAEHNQKFLKEGDPDERRTGKPTNRSAAWRSTHKNKTRSLPSETSPKSQSKLGIESILDGDVKIKTSQMETSPFLALKAKKETPEYDPDDFPGSYGSREYIEERCQRMTLPSHDDFLEDDLYEELLRLSALKKGTVPYTLDSSFSYGLDDEPTVFCAQDELEDELFEFFMETRPSITDKDLPQIDTRVAIPCGDEAMADPIGVHLPSPETDDSTTEYSDSDDVPICSQCVQPTVFCETGALDDLSVSQMMDWQSFPGGWLPATGNAHPADKDFECEAVNISAQTNGQCGAKETIPSEQFRCDDDVAASMDDYAPRFLLRSTHLSEPSDTHPGLVGKTSLVDDELRFDSVAVTNSRTLVVKIKEWFPSVPSVWLRCEGSIPNKSGHFPKGKNYSQIGRFCSFDLPKFKSGCTDIALHYTPIFRAVGSLGCRSQTLQQWLRSHVKKKRD